MWGWAWHWVVCTTNGAIRVTGAIIAWALTPAPDGDRERRLCPKPKESASLSQKSEFPCEAVLKQAVKAFSSSVCPGAVMPAILSRKTQVCMTQAALPLPHTSHLSCSPGDILHWPLPPYPHPTPRSFWSLSPHGASAQIPILRTPSLPSSKGMAPEQADHPAQPQVLGQIPEPRVQGQTP